MAFSDLASNQLVSDTNASSGGFVLKAGQSHTSTGKIMTKDEALAKYDLVAATMSGYTGNRLVPKSVWEANITESIQLDIYLRISNLAPIVGPEIWNYFSITDTTTSTFVYSIANISYDTDYTASVTLYQGHTYFVQGGINETFSTDTFCEINWSIGNNPAESDFTYFDACKTNDYNSAYERQWFTINSIEEGAISIELFGGGFIDTSGTPFDTCLAP